MQARARQNAEISALLVAPGRALAERFLARLAEARAFQVAAELREYPAAEALGMRLRQVRPQVLLLDVETDLAAAVALIRHVVAAHPDVHAVGLHNANDAEAILQTLRAGAVEFLHAPFDPVTQREAAARIRRLLAPEPAPASEGQVIGFASAKPGSGSSTLATQTAFALHRLTGERVLLADCDLTGGTIGFYLKLSHNYSVVDALQHVERLDGALWGSLAVQHGGVHILPSPAMPYAERLVPERLKLLAEQARLAFDWVILDLPPVFSRTTLLALAECDRAFLVSTAELPSLHLTRKGLVALEQLSFPRERFRVVVNRAGGSEEMSAADMEKLFGCAVHARMPNDYFTLHRVVTLGQPLAGEGELGRAVESLAQGIRQSLGGRTALAAKPAAPRESRALLSRV
jgi:pilus assembly protein CpaE